MLPAPRSPDGHTIREDQPIPAERGTPLSIIPLPNLLERLNQAIERRTRMVRLRGPAPSSPPSADGGLGERSRSKSTRADWKRPATSTWTTCDRNKGAQRMAA